MGDCRRHSESGVAVTVSLKTPVEKRLQRLEKLGFKVSRKINREDFPNFFELATGGQSYTTKVLVLHPSKEIPLRGVNGLKLELSEDGLVVGTPLELLEYAKSWPKLRLYTSVIALGLDCQHGGKTCFICLFRDKDGYHILPFSADDGFDDNSLFLIKDASNHRNGQ